MSVPALRLETMDGSVTACGYEGTELVQDRFSISDGAGAIDRKALYFGAFTSETSPCGMGDERGDRFRLEMLVDNRAPDFLSKSACTLEPEPGFSGDKACWTCS